MLTEGDVPGNQEIDQKIPEPPKTFYSVVGPGTICPQSEYHVAVSLHESEEPTTIEVGIQGRSFSSFKTVELQPYSIEYLKFDIPDIPKEWYYLKAKGLSGLTFTNQINLNFNIKYVLMIQTDKATYKPGDLIRYRVFALDRGLRPIEAALTIIIMDEDSNIIKQHTNVRAKYGVYIGELQLSSCATLGYWGIKLTVNQQSASKYFEIAEYVLPKFKTSIESAKDVLFDDGKIHITVRAKYTYGKPVKGKVDVNVKKFKKVFDIIGEARLEISLKDLSLTNMGQMQRIQIEISVEDSLTGERQTVTKDVMVHFKRYCIKPVNLPSYYIPDELFDISAEISTYDGTPAQDTTVSLVLFRINQSKKIELNRLKEVSDKNGVVTFNFSLPNIKEPLKVHIECKNVIEDLGYLSKIPKRFLQDDAESLPETEVPRNEFHIVQLIANPEIHEEIDFEVNSPEKMKYFIYQIVARGDILETKLIEVPDEKVWSFKFQPTHMMSPEAHVYVYMVKDGKLIFDEKTIYFPKELGNFVDIDIQEEAKPGEEIDIQVKAKPNSYIGLLGVDESVIILKSGNDITKNTAFDQIKNFACNTPYIKGYGRYPGCISGVVTLTNSYYYWEIPKIRKTDKIRVGCAADPPRLEKKKKNQELGSTPVIRKFFPETWIWDDLSNISNEGSTILHKKVPDTITSWILTGFSIDPINGLGIIEKSVKLKVFQPFFISTNLPYSVKRGEIIGIPIIVFNYTEEVLDAEITLHNEDEEFDFSEIDDKKQEIKRTQKLTVASNSGEAVSFMIRPKKVGNIKIKVTAITPITGDAIEQMLLVEPEGVTEFINKAVFIDLCKNPEQKVNTKIEIPKNAVPDSTHIEVSIVGDILGPTISNLDELIRIPYGCGEQNMVHFVPNILVLKYLESIGQLTPEIESKAKKFLEIGYQRQLTYKHNDGSYSAFGECDISGSTWLTAYVARSFRQATKYTLIDEDVIISALNFLVSTQAKDGSFPEVGRLFDKHEGGSEGLSLTAFTVLAFFENDKTIPNYKENIGKALDYIAKNIETKDLYALALSAYVLQIAKHSAADSAIKKLEGRATKDGDKKYWNKPIAKPKTGECCCCYGPKSVDVEMTSYALLALLETDQAVNSLHIAKWLISQRNSNGGFNSTQDTVVGLQALTKFAQNLSVKDCNIDINIKDGEDVKGKLTVNKDNAIVLQSYELPSTLKEVSVIAKGKGVALAQVSYRYNINNNEPNPSFVVNAKIDNISNSDYLKLLICTSFVPGEGDVKESNMALIEVSLPSGFTIENEAIKSLEKMEGVKKVETKKGHSVIVLYFDSLGTKEVCPVVEAYKTHKVDELKPSPIIVYDYYDNSRQARVFYDAP